MQIAAWLIDQLVLQGVKHFCIAPGSRSTSLALAAEEHPETTTHVHFDERGLGFFALGISMGTKAPAAVIVTSGTAVANLASSAWEATASGHPLLLLTADRPAELHDCGANQTMDQAHLFGSGVVWQTDIPPDLGEKIVRSLGAQGVFHARQGGAVHLNCRFREPFDLSQVRCPAGAPFFSSQPILSPPEPIERSEKRGLIAVGALHEDPTPIGALAKRLQWPIFADILANLHTEEKISSFDRLLGSEKPDFVLHFGARLTSKKFPEWIQEIPTFHVGPDPKLVDPTRSLQGRIQSHIAPFCATFSAKTDPSWLPLWKEKAASYEKKLSTALKMEPFGPAHALRSASQAWKQGAVFLGNSLPIREANLYASFQVPVFANRGVSGIDGSIATAAGIAAGTKKPVLAWIGDQAALYDLNSLALLTRYPITLVIVNNRGGGIFSHLPVATSPHLNRLFTAEHSWDFEQAAKMFSLPYVKVSEEFSDQLSPGVVEFMTCRDHSLRLAKL